MKDYALYAHRPPVRVQRSMKRHPSGFRHLAWYTCHMALRCSPHHTSGRWPCRASC